MNLLLTLLLTACLATVDQAQTPAGGGQRSSTGQSNAGQRIRDAVDALDLKEGSHVADLGAGDGDYEEELSLRVGATGHVYAVDIDEKRAIPNLRKLVEKKSLKNVTVVVSEPANPKLPVGELDAVLIVIAYHEMTAYQEILGHIRAALKPGGRLVIIEIRPLPAFEKGTRAEQSSHHQLAADFAEPELRDAGFEIVERRDKFVVSKTGPRGGRWMIIARKAQ